MKLNQIRATKVVELENVKDLKITISLVNNGFLRELENKYPNYINPNDQDSIDASTLLFEKHIIEWNIEGEDDNILEVTPENIRLFIDQLSLEDMKILVSKITGNEIDKKK